MAKILLNKKVATVDIPIAASPVLWFLLVEKQKAN